MDRFFCLLYILLLISCSASEPKTNNKKPINAPNEYYSNGNIRIEKIINGNEEHWIFKQEDGGCWEEKFFRNGEEYKKIVYNSDCMKSAEYELKNGMRHGEWKSYYENGGIRENGKYKSGVADGVTEYYNNDGKLDFKEQNIILDSTPVHLFFNFRNDYSKFIDYLKNKGVKFEVRENIEVAGNKEYHFPEIHFNNSVLYFDRKENNEVIRCLSGNLNDCTFEIFGKFCPDQKDLLKLLNYKYEKGFKKINFYDTTQHMLYSFEIENDLIKNFNFSPIQIRY